MAPRDSGSAAASGFTVRDLELRAFTAAELLSMELPRRETVLAPWLPAKGLAMVYGPRGIGKTHVGLGIAYAVATGGPFLRWRAPAPRGVLILDGEMPAVVLRERLAAIAANAATEPPQPDFLRLLPLDLQERGLDLSDLGHQAQLERLLDGVDLIVVDNISTLVAGGKENEAESWLPVQQWALAHRRAGRSVVLRTMPARAGHNAGRAGGRMCSTQ